MEIEDENAGIDQELPTYENAGGMAPGYDPSGALPLPDGPPPGYEEAQVDYVVESLRNLS